MHVPSNKVHDIERYCLTELASVYSEGEIRQMVKMLFEAYLGWDTATFLLHHNDTINQSELLKFYWAVEALKEEKPIQQIIGYTYFCDCCIIVTPNVLIPRPETEEIVEYTQRLFQESLNSQQVSTPIQASPIFSNKSPIRIIDLCTGSGCVAIALAKAFPSASVYGIDVSAEALLVAQTNAQQNRVVVNFIECDLLNSTTEVLDSSLPEGFFDLIISNPPYIQESAKSSLCRNVLNYEPGLALFVNDADPLLFYRQIGIYAQSHLAPGGYLIVEINELFGWETCSLLQSFGFKTVLHQDFNGKDRMIVASSV